MKIECENCKKDIMDKRGFQIMIGKVGIVCDEVGFPDAVTLPKQIKEDGMFCSLKCIKMWLQRLLK